MDKLCEKKLIKRFRCDDDRRSVFLEITDQGLELLAKINIDDQKSAFFDLSDEEALQFNQLLDKIRISF